MYLGKQKIYEIFNEKKPCKATQSIFFIVNLTQTKLDLEFVCGNEPFCSWLPSALSEYNLV